MPQHLTGSKSPQHHSRHLTPCRQRPGSGQHDRRWLESYRHQQVVGRSQPRAISGQPASQHSRGTGPHGQALLLWCRQRAVNRQRQPVSRCPGSEAAKAKPLTGRPGQSEPASHHRLTKFGQQLIHLIHMIHMIMEKRR